MLGSIHGHSPNIICIQETLRTESEGKKLFIDGFQLFFAPADSTQPSSIQKRGLLIAVSNDILTKPLPQTSCPLSGDLTESLSVEIMTTEGPLQIHNVYVHQKNDAKTLTLKPSKEKHLITGDFNSRCSEWEPPNGSSTSSPRGNKLRALLQDSPSFVLCNSPGVPTTVHNTTLTLSIISAELAAVTDWSVLSDCVGSPHIATSTTVNISPPAIAPPFRSKPILEKADWDSFFTSSDNPNAIPDYLDPSAPLEDLCHSIVDIIQDAAHKSIPRTKPHSSIPSYQCWWFNDKCKEAKGKLNRAVADNRKNRPGARGNLRKVRADTLQVFEKAKHEKWNQICQSLDLSSSLGSHWRRLRWLYNGGSPPKPVLVDLAEAKATADKAMQNFSDRSHKHNLNLATKLVLDELTPIRDQSISIAISDLTGLCSEPLTMEEWDEALSVAKNSSPGEDDVLYVYLSHIGHATRLQIIHLYNRSLTAKKSPNQWKTIPIVPIPKKEEGEFRPIALLSCIAKVMERMILNRLRFLIGPLHPNLMGCTKGKGTTDAIATLTKMASDAKYRRSGPRSQSLKLCLAIFIDFEKAFELANITTLLGILATDKGIKGNMLGWLQDYLLDRKGYTTVQGVKSDVLPLHQGTPQGSVLSPYLFNILIDKLLNIIYESLPIESARNVIINSYADDIVLVSNHWNAKNNLDLALRRLELASVLLGLKVNLKKTKAMAWNHSNSFPSYNYTVYQNKIEWVRTFKYLGIIFDDNLSFTKHIEDVISRANKRLNVLKHMAGSPYGATQKTLLHYFKSCIRPILEYGSIALLIACPSSIQRLESFQNTALKIALRVPRHTRTKLVLVESGCSTIEDRIHFLSVVAMAKIKAFSQTHPYFQFGREMHNSPHMLGTKPKHKSDLPLDLVLQKLESDYHTPIISPLELPPDPPNTPHIRNHIAFDIKPLPKRKLSLSESELAEIALNLTQYIQSTFCSHVNLYVDGAKDPETGRAGAGFYVVNDSQKVRKNFRLSDHISSTQAELAAIYLVLNYIRDQNLWKDVVIHCDSLPSILTLKYYSPDPLKTQVQLIFQLLKVLFTNTNFHLTFHWTPSHINIEGNEIADQLASLGMKLPEITFITPPTIGQVKASFKEVISKKNTIWFNSQPSGSAYHNYHSINTSLKPPNQVASDPMTQQWINRLKMETDVKCYQHDSRNVCGYCNHPFSSVHYLIECPVTASPDFLECLTIDQHQNHPKSKAQAILHSLNTSNPHHYFLKGLRKRFPKVKCTHPEHGLITTTFLKVPSNTEE